MVVAAKPAQAQTPTVGYNPGYVRSVFAHAPSLDTPAEAATRKIVTDALRDLSGQARLNPTTTVYSPTGAAVSSSSLVSAEQAASTSVARSAWMTRLAAAKTALPRVMGPIGLGLTAFTTGYAIGTGINKLFFKADVVAAPSGPGTVTLDPVCVAGGSFTCSAGETTLNVSTGTPIPDPGRYWWAKNSAWGNHWYTGAPSGQGCPSAPAPGAKYQIQLWGPVCEAAMTVLAGGPGDTSGTVTVAAPKHWADYDPATDPAVSPAHEVAALPEPTSDADVATAIAAPAADPIVDVWDRTITGTQPQADPAADPAPEPNSQPDPVGHPGPDTIPAIDLSPLEVAAPCTTFPFGVPCWVLGALGGFSGAGACPSIDFPLPDISGADSLPIDFCEVQPMVDVFRPVLAIASLLGLAWMFMGAAMGFGGTGTED